MAAVATKLLRWLPLQRSCLGGKLNYSRMDDSIPSLTLVFARGLILSNFYNKPFLDGQRIVLVARLSQNHVELIGRF